MTKTKTKPGLKKFHYQILLGLIIGLNIILRLPSLWEPTSYGDECIYLTLGQALNRGAVFYRDIHDNKPPLLYFVAALAQGKLSYLRIFSIFWSSFNIWLIAKIIKILTKKYGLMVLASGLFFIFSFLPEGRIANGELFMIMPATLGALVALKAGKSFYRWFLTGFCFSLAFLFKIPVAFDFVGLLVGVFIMSVKTSCSIFQVIKNKQIYVCLLGFILPILASIVYYAHYGAFVPYVRSALMQNIGYLASWSGGQSSGLYYRLVILILVISIIFLLRKRLGSKFALFSTVLAFSLFGVFLSERPYPHYLIEAAPWLAILLVILIDKFRPARLIISLLLINLLSFGFIKYNYWWYPILPYYQNFIKFASGQISQGDYLAYFGQKNLEDYYLSRYLKTLTPADKPLLVWGDSACVYALTERSPVGRYTVSYHIKDFNGFEATAQAAKVKIPKYIVKLTAETTAYPQLDSLLASDYLLIKTFDYAEIYRRLN